MRSLFALLVASTLALTACGDGDATPLGAEDDTDSTETFLPPTAPTDPRVLPDPTTVDDAGDDGEELDGESAADDAEVDRPSGEQLEGELAAARDRWEALDVSGYTMEQTVVAQMVDYVGPFSVTVEDGAVAEVAYTPETLATAETPPSDVEVATVEEIFDLIARSIGVADEVRVTYDPTTGVPTDVWIDESRQMADEEIGYTVVVEGLG